MKRIRKKRNQEKKRKEKQKSRKEKIKKIIEGLVFGMGKKNIDYFEVSERISGKSFPVFIRSSRGEKLYLALLNADVSGKEIIWKSLRKQIGYKITEYRSENVRLDASLVESKTMLVILEQFLKKEAISPSDRLKKEIDELTDKYNAVVREQRNFALNMRKINEYMDEILDIKEFFFGEQENRKTGNVENKNEK